jgi:hypothetical protein
MPQKFPLVFKEEQEPVSKKSRTFQGLGIDYGLIFIRNCTNRIGFTLDGTKAENLASGGNYNGLFFDKEQNKLYYTRFTSLYEWPDKLVKDFGTKSEGIAKYKKEIIVVLRNSDQIANIEGKILFSNLSSPYNIAEFQGKLYHTEGALTGIVETPDKHIATTGAWTNGLDVSPDGKRLYFGGCSCQIYSYDGKEVKGLCRLDNSIWTIQTVKEKNEVIYCAGSGYGIEKIILSGDKILEKKMIFGELSNVGSIVHAPIDFIKKLEEIK